MHAPGLREALDAVYARFNRPELIDPDPLGPVRAYADPADREVVGLLAACLAYGRVRSILNSLERLLPQLNLSPGEKSRSDPVARSCRERAPPVLGLVIIESPLPAEGGYRMRARPPGCTQRHPMTLKGPPAGSNTDGRPAGT